MDNSRPVVPLVSGKIFKALSPSKKFLVALGIICNATRIMFYVQRGDKFVRLEEQSINLASDYKSEFASSYKFEIDPETGFENVDGICNFSELAERAAAYQRKFEGDKGSGLYIPVRFRNPITGEVERALIVAEREFWNRDGTLRWRESYLPKHIERTPVVPGDEIFAQAAIDIATLVVGHFKSVLFPDSELTDERRREGFEQLRKKAKALAEDDVSSIEILRVMTDKMLEYLPPELQRHVKAVGATTKGLVQTIIDKGNSKNLLPQKLRDNSRGLDRIELEWTNHDDGKLFIPSSWFFINDAKRTIGQKRRSHRHPVGSYMVMDGIPYLFQYASDSSSHHWDRRFAMPRTFLAAIGAVADFSSALMDPRVEYTRSYTLLESYTVIGNLMFTLIRKNDEAVERGEGPEVPLKSLALLLKAYIEFMSHGIMEKYAEAREPLYPQSFSDHGQGVTHHHKNTKGVQYSPDHTLESLDGSISGYTNDIEDMLTVIGIRRDEKHDEVCSKLMRHFKMLLVRSDMKECLRLEVYRLNSDVDAIQTNPERRDGFLFTDALYQSSLRHLTQ